MWLWYLCTFHDALLKTIRCDKTNFACLWTKYRSTFRKSDVSFAHLSSEISDKCHKQEIVAIISVSKATRKVLFFLYAKCDHKSWISLTNPHITYIIPIAIEKWSFQMTQSSTKNWGQENAWSSISKKQNSVKCEIAQKNWRSLCACSFTSRLFHWSILLICNHMISLV